MTTQTPTPTIADEIRAFMVKHEKSLYANCITGWFEDALDDLAQQEKYALPAEDNRAAFDQTGMRVGP